MAEHVATSHVDRQVQRTLNRDLWKGLSRRDGCSYVRRAKPGGLRDTRNTCRSAVQGVHSNDEIRREKGGAFVMSEDEKDVVLRSCRFVDEIVHDIPYDEMSPTVLDRADIRCHVASHGD